MMASQEMVLNQFGFFLSFTVLLDTFVVRTMVVPAAVHLLGGSNWWPTRMPEPTKGPDHIESYEEQEAEADAAAVDGTAPVVPVNAGEHDDHYARALDGSAAASPAMASHGSADPTFQSVDPLGSPSHTLARMTVTDDAEDDT
jgi:hypothetical protein